MTTSYRAWAAPKAGAPLEPFEYDPGPLGADEVEITVDHCGLCHSDLSMLDNEWGFTAYPFVPGHEAVGRVTALGANAKGVAMGQRVGLGWNAHSCEAQSASSVQGAPKVPAVHWPVLLPAPIAQRPELQLPSTAQSAASAPLVQEPSS